jgi:hypothetical protein
LFITNEDYETEFYIVDDSGDRPNIGFKYGKNGLDAAKVSDHFKSLFTTTGGSQTVLKESNFFY